MTKIWLKKYVKNQCNYPLSWQCTPLVLIKRDRQAFSLHRRLCYLKIEMDPRDGQNFFFIATFCLVP